MKSRKSIDTSRWVFPEEEKKFRNNHLGYLSPSTEKREQEAKKINHQLDVIRSRELIKSFESCTSPESAAKLASILNVSLSEESPEEIPKAEQSHRPRRHTASQEVLGSVEDFEAKSSEPGADEESVSQNAYWNLLHRIQKAEKEKKHSDPETIAYKLVEERLDKIAAEFCEWTSCLMLPEDKRQSSDLLSEEAKRAEMVIQPEKLRKLFHVELCQPTLCPYIPFIIREARELPQQLHEKRKNQKTAPADEVTEEERRKLKQAYYLPPAEWFCQKDKSSKTEFTIEEEEFIKSFGFKKYLLFLEERGEEPPKIFEDLKKRHKEQLKKFKEDQKFLEKRKNKC